MSGGNNIPKQVRLALQTSKRISKLPKQWRTSAFGHSSEECLAEGFGGDVEKQLHSLFGEK